MRLISGLSEANLVVSRPMYPEPQEAESASLCAVGFEGFLTTPSVGKPSRSFKSPCFRKPWPTLASLANTRGRTHPHTSTHTHIQNTQVCACCLHTCARMCIRRMYVFKLYMYVYLFIWVSVLVYYSTVYLHANLHSAFMYMCECAWGTLQALRQQQMFMYMHTCIYVFMCVCQHVFMYVFMHIQVRLYKRIPAFSKHGTWPLYGNSCEAPRPKRPGSRRRVRRGPCFQLLLFGQGRESKGRSVQGMDSKHLETRFGG